MAMTKQEAMARLHSIAFGTGHGIYTSMINRAIAEAHDEIILVTCFWAASPTLTMFNEALRNLSKNAVDRGTRIKVRICFSSSSFFQKLFHTLSASGQSYASNTWTSTLGLPSPEELQGLNLRVKSIFCLPFSVMHPKFVIIDRKRVFLPSCNVSWEEWFEGCLEVSGPITDSFLGFWQGFWADEDERELPPLPESETASYGPPTTGLLASQSLDGDEALAVFLPSPHHRFSLPWLTSEQPPSTPLNCYLLDLFDHAVHDISIQTPNLTCQAVLDALIRAITRGVNLSITTSQRLMRMEQIVTAGKTTERAATQLIAQYTKLRDRYIAKSNADLEAGLTGSTLGSLSIRYYRQRLSGDPVQSHLKLTITDGAVAVLGSGNMDRASWFTSQELGLAIRSKETVRSIKDTLAKAMDGRSVAVFDSEAT